jgi:hypothetical protein
MRAESHDMKGKGTAIRSFEPIILLVEVGREAICYLRMRGWYASVWAQARVEAKKSGATSGRASLVFGRLSCNYLYEQPQLEVSVLQSHQLRALFPNVGELLVLRLHKDVGLLLRVAYQ